MTIHLFGGTIPNMDMQLTSRHAWLSTLIFGALALALLVPLVLLSRPSALGEADFASAARPLFAAGPLVAGSALFWGIVAVVALLRFWDLYYRYFYPAWFRYVVPLDFLLYGAIGLGLWWLAVRLPGPALLGFVLLGGLEGVAEHLLGIYGFRILDRVPWLRGVSALPVVVFSFFEYVLYWTLVGWLALGLAQIMA